MLLHDSKTILAAIGRSLEEHVLPHLDDDFARVQLAAAQAALREVIDRISEGDPVDAWNAAVETGAKAIADEAEGDAPEFARALNASLADLPSDISARDRNKILGEALWELAAADDSPAAGKLLELIKDTALAFAAQDTRYICAESVASLT